MIRNIFTFVGAITSIFMVIAFIIGIIIVVNELIYRIKRKRRIKHRFDKPRGEDTDGLR